MKINDNVTFLRKKYFFFSKKQQATIFSLHQVKDESYASVIFIEKNVKMGKVLKLKDLQLVIPVVKDSNPFKGLMVVILVLFCFFGLFLIREEIVAEFNDRVQVIKINFYFI